MTKAEKLRRRILSSPTPSDITNQELKTFLEQLGLEEISTGKTAGSRIRFVNPHNRSEQIRLHKAHGSTPVDQGALKDTIARLKEMGFLD